ncbi:tryptophan--tRNA ligase [Patescibacteria group bacterium]
MKRILSGIRVSGRPHLGNYLGAMRQHIEIQEQPDCEAFYFMANLHTLTTVHDKNTMVANSIGTVLDYLALGLDPKKSTIFLQSDVPGHTELAWIFSTLTSVSEAERIPTFKEKKLEQAKDINMGLLSYPVLMAADILMYKADEVPVGADQRPNVEMARDIAKRFNNTYGETFPIPKFTTRKETTKIMSLDGKGKMSKSSGSGVGIFEETDDIMAKFKKATTDSDSDIRFSEDKPEISNLLTLYMAFSGKDEKTVIEEMKGKGYDEFKELLGTTVAKNLTPFREKRRELQNNVAEVESILADGAKKAQKIASQTMKEVKDKVGLTL